MSFIKMRLRIRESTRWVGGIRAGFPEIPLALSSDIFSEETVSIPHNQRYSDSKIYTNTNIFMHQHTLLEGALEKEMRIHEFGG